MARGEERGRDRSRFRDLSEIAKLINAGSDFQTVLRRLTRGVCRHSIWSMSGIQALDMAQRQSIPIARYDPYSDENAPFPTGWDAGTSPIRKVLEERKPLIIEDAADQDQFPGYRDDARRRCYRTVVLVPLDGHDHLDRPMVFSVIAREAVAPDEAEIDFLRCIADLTDIALEKLRRLEAGEAAAQQLRSMAESLADVMSQALSADKDTKLLTALTQLLPRRWLALDLTVGKLIHDPASPPEILAEGSETLMTVLMAKARDVTDTGFREVTLIEAGTERYEAYAEPIVIDGMHIGAIFLFGPEKLGEQQRLAAESGRLALSSHLLRDFALFQTRAISSELLMRRLLEGVWRDLDEVRVAARALDFELEPPLRLLLVGTREEGALDEALHRSCLRLSQRVFGASLSGRVDAEVVLLVGDSPPLVAEDPNSSFLGQLAFLLKGKPVLALSPVIEQLSEISAAWQQCLRRIKIARALGHDGWVTNQQLGAFTGLIASVDGGTIDRFLNDTIGPLAENGSKRGRSNIETLEAFLECGGRYQQAANRLGIHVSTLRYRLGQIGDRYGIDFADLDVTFDLEVALRLYRLRNSYKS